MYLPSIFLEMEEMDSENIKKQKGKSEKSFMRDLLLEALLLRFIPTKQERSIRIAFMNRIQVSKPIKGGYRKSPNPFLDKESCKRNLLLSTAPKESIKKGLEIVDFKCIFQMESTALIIKVKNTRIYRKPVIWSL